MARMIDASRFGEILEQWKKDCLEDNDIQGADIILDVILQLDDMPTLTPPNEGVKDKNVPTNEPLTLEELREMDGQPFYDCASREWYIVDYVWGSMLYTAEGVYFNFGEEETTDRFYRRPPEGEKET